MTPLPPGARQPAVPCTAARHGTASAAKNAGCTCPDAKREAARYWKRRRVDHARHVPRLVPVVGAQRRLQALAAIGWPAAELARRLGHATDDQVKDWRAGRSSRGASVMRRSNYQAISRLYDQLQGTAGPSAGARQHAAKNRWLPPLAWDDVASIELPDDIDTVLVDRCVAGLVVGEQLSRAERDEVIRVMHATGYLDRDIAGRLACHTTLVCLDRKRLGLPANADHGRRVAG